MNEFEQFSSVGHQMSVAEGVGPGSGVQGVPYHVTYPMMHLMLLIPYGETDIHTCEDFSFPQLLLRPVNNW